MRLFYLVMLFILFADVAIAESISVFVTPEYEFDEYAKQFIKDKKYDKIVISIVNPDNPTKNQDFNQIAKLCGYTEKSRTEADYVANTLAEIVLDKGFQFPVFVTDKKCFNLTDVINDMVKKTSSFNLTGGDVVDADALFTEYQANKYAFNQKYNNKIVSVSGLLRTIGADGNISLATSKTFHSVKCLVQNKDRVVSLRKEQTVTITGRYVQESNMIDLELYNCVIK